MAQEVPREGEQSWGWPVGYPGLKTRGYEAGVGHNNRTCHVPTTRYTILNQPVAMVNETDRSLGEGTKDDSNY